MRPFGYERATDVADALARADGRERVRFLAGGTTLVDLMKLDVEAPATVVDINALPLAEIAIAGGRLTLGALVRMSDAAAAGPLRLAIPALAQALDAGASAQLRNMATLGGNVMQRTRCSYFRDVASACNKREPGSGCAALAGDNARHAVLGTTEACIAVHPSDFAVPLVAFDGAVAVRGTAGTRTIPAAEFFLRPEHPKRETALRAGELIVSLSIPCTPAAARSAYLKVRDRASYEFALASCAAGVELAADGTIADVRLALGGVATIPWRCDAAEAALRGRLPEPRTLEAAAQAEVAGARPTAQNAYRVELARRVLVRALEAVCRTGREDASP